MPWSPKSVDEGMMDDGWMMKDVRPGNGRKLWTMLGSSNVAVRCSKARSEGVSD